MKLRRIKVLTNFRMSAGYIQLAAIGQQDAYITGSPSKTYFSGVYYRHTPFVLEAYDIPFLGDKLLFGSEHICKIPFKGDIIRGLTLKTKLPGLPYSAPNSWSYPTPASDAFQPYFIVDGVTTVYTSLGVSFYTASQNTKGNWIVGPISDYIDYDASTYKFFFKGCTTVEVPVFIDPTQPSGVFWGLDPKTATSIDPSNGNLIYDLTVHGYLADFTTEQSGWVRGEASAVDNIRGGYYLALNTSQPPWTSPAIYTGASTYFMNVASQNFTSFGLSPYAVKTSRGSIRFDSPGNYLIRGSINSDSPVYSISYGTTDTDGRPASASVLYSYTHTWRVSSGPTMPFMLPITINVAGTYAYLDIDGTFAESSTILPPTYVSVGPLDIFYNLVNNYTSATSTFTLPLTLFNENSYVYSNILSLATNNTFTFFNEGTYTASCFLTVDNDVYVRQIAIKTGSTYIYTYTTDQGRNPTYDFVLPINVTDTTTIYSIEITASSSSATLLGSNASHISFVQCSSPQTAGSVAAFPENGLFFTPKSGTAVPTPSGANTYTLNLGSDFNSTGVSTSINQVGTGMTFSNVGVYMMTAVVCTDEALTSISFGNQNYPIGLGLLPPYTFSVPLYVTDKTTQWNVSITSSGSSTGIYSNTYMSVVPYASNIQETAFNYYDSVGTYMIQKAELRIGNQLIQSLTGEMIELWNDLNIPYENQPGLTLLTGKLDTSNVNDPGRTYYTNLPFYFYGNPELSIPIAALDRHDVELYVTFKNFTDLTPYSNIAALSQNFGGLITQPLDATVIVEYGYLSENEINWMKKSKLDYVITQTQVSTYTLDSGFTSGVFNLPFINPVRELFFVIQANGNAPYDFTQNGLLSMTLSFNGQEFFSRRDTDALYLGTIEPYKHHIHDPDRNFFMYSFSQDPNDPRPNGQVNFSRINQKLLEVNTLSSGVPRQLRVYALSYNIMRVENGLAGILFNFF